MLSYGVNDMLSRKHNSREKKEVRREARVTTWLCKYVERALCTTKLYSSDGQSDKKVSERSQGDKRKAFIFLFCMRGRGADSPLCMVCGRPSHLQHAPLLLAYYHAVDNSASTFRPRLKRMFGGGFN